MSFHFSPRIITDSLVLYLDAGNTRSYPGSGTTWSDLSRGGNNGVLTNGPTFNSSNGGSIVFDGLDDYIELGSVDSNNPLSLYGQTEFSIDLWLKPDYTGDEFQRVIDKSSNASGADGWCVVYPHSTSNSFYLFIDGSQILGYSDSSADGSWRNFILTRNGNTTKLYINSTLVSTTTVTKTIPINTTNMRIGTWNHSTAREYNGKIGNIKIYTRTLLDNEVLQNYNATKTRFGL